MVCSSSIGGEPSSDHGNAGTLARFHSGFGLEQRARLAGSVGRIERTSSPRMPPYGGVSVEPGAVPPPVHLRRDYVGAVDKNGRPQSGDLPPSLEPAP
jgi:hypothetical protein